ncbi:MAG: VTT domain-containing protein [Eubacteriales bacterium]|nr:VTT domain-containing protein [Eubacteriales bacterium]
MAKEELVAWIQRLMTLEFWEQALDAFQALGPVVPIALAALESIIPPLPLVAIVTLNIAGHGAILGFLYSWVGTCLGCTIVFFFYRKVLKHLVGYFAQKHEKIKRAQEWVGGIRPSTLFLLAVLPFTPSSFLNFAFGVSEFSAKRYLLTMYLAKSIMIGSLALFGQSMVSALENPVYIILAVAVVAALYVLSLRVSKRHHVEGV